MSLKMRLTEKSSNAATNISQMIKDEIYNSKLIKSGLFIGVGVLGLFALGFLFKAINYTADNFKNLNETLKR